MHFTFGFPLMTHPHNQELLDARALGAMARAAEDAGFDAVSLTEHPIPHDDWLATGGHDALDPFVGLSFAAAATSRVRLLTNLTPLPYRNPALLAKTVATLDRLSGGRVILGVGTGEGLNEVPSTGMVWPEMKERFARLREAIGLIRKLWAEDHVSFEGEYYKTQNATIYDKPGAFVPIYVAGAGPQVAKYAGRMADGFICTSGKKWDLYTDTLLPNVAEGLKLSSRPKPDYDRMIEMKVSFDTDKKRALDDTRIWAALALTPEEKMTVHDPKEMERLADALPVERAASRWIVSFDPDEHIEKIKPYIDMGFRHLVFHAPGNDQARFLKIYGEMVLPKLRARFG